MTKRIKAHTHDWRDHPNPQWSTHAACRICGFAVPKRLLAQAGIKVNCS